MRPTYPTPKCHCWNVARDGHATDCVDTGLDVERLHRALLHHQSVTMENRLHVCVGGVGSCASDIAAAYLAEAGGPSRLASREEPTE